MDEIFGAFEVHDPAGIRATLAAGTDPRAVVRGRSLTMALVEMYTRSPRFAECMAAMLDAGGTLGDPVLEACLLDDDAALAAHLAEDARHGDRRFDLACAYTSLRGASALHVCAEYNSVRCLRVLLDAGLDVDTPAGVDADGIGGHTAIFHTVNSNGAHCRPALELLVDAGARLDLLVPRLSWGGGFEWETLIFDVTPVSYAQCGLYHQFHRREEPLYDNIEFMLERREGHRPPRRNVPNRYAQDGGYPRN